MISPSEAHLCDPRITGIPPRSQVCSPFPKDSPIPIDETPKPMWRAGSGCCPRSRWDPPVLLCPTKMKHQLPKEEGKCRTFEHLPEQILAGVQPWKQRPLNCGRCSGLSLILLLVLPPPAPQHGSGGDAAAISWHCPACASELTARSLCQQDRLSIHKNGLVSPQS